MLHNSHSRRATEVSEELKTLRARSINYSDKAAKVLSKAIGQLKFVLNTLTNSAWGGAGPKKIGEPF